jgi:outer membrane protein TolC
MNMRALAPVASFALLLGLAAAQAGSDKQPHPTKVPGPRGPQPITLDAALRLAGASNLDVRIARERLAEAEANHLIAVEQFFPSVSPGLGYKRHEGSTQAVDGTIVDVDKELYTAGAIATAQVEFGEAIFRTLAARQLVRAASHAAVAQKQESIYQAALAYFDLARAHAAVSVANESVRIAEDYAQQVTQAVEAGLAFKGDLYRATTQVERNRLSSTQAREQERLAASRLALVLNLDPEVELAPAGGELTPIQLISDARSLDSLVAEAMAGRPELKQYAAQLEAARKNRQGAIYGPLIPSAGGQVFYGGLGGGTGSPGPRDFDQSSDYSAGISWRIGPGGLFDTGRIRANDARVRTGTLELEKVRDEVTRQVVDAHTRTHSLSAQIQEARRALEAAEQTLKLARERREFAVGAVLEAVQAEQDLTHARLDYVNAVADYNKAQYALERARGALSPAERQSGGNKVTK